MALIRIGRGAGRRLALLSALFVFGCGRGGAEGDLRRLTVTIDTTAAHGGSVTIDGIDPSLIRQIAAPNQRVAIVRVGGGDSSTPPPPVAGQWRVVGSRIEFVPRYRPTAGIALVVTIDTAALLGRASALPMRTTATIGNDGADAAPTRIVAIHPAIDSVPENLLRFYLEFSHPMRPGQSLASVRLLDDRGAEVRAAFLDVSEELWDPSGRRLTLLFDPGRVKQGIRTNLEVGRPLRRGHRYTLTIDSAWLDVRGRPLAASIDKPLIVGPADQAGPNPAHWLINAPAAGTSAPVIVELTEPLDYALVNRLIAVTGQDGQPVLGATLVSNGDRRWSFTPTRPWSRGEYLLRVSSELEDIAGNRPDRLFDTDVTAATGPAATLTRRFSVR